MGATSQVSGLAAAATIAVILVFLTGPIQYLPAAVLGAVIVFAAARLIDVDQWRSLAVSSEAEVVITAITTLFVIIVKRCPLTSCRSDGCAPERRRLRRGGAFDAIYQGFPVGDGGLDPPTSTV